MQTKPIRPQRHFPSPYVQPNTLPCFAAWIETPDHAKIASFVYSPQADTELLHASDQQPILMLHGNGEEHGIFGPMIDACIASGHAVIALDSRAQGKSTRGTEPLSYELMANDALAVLDALDVPRVHVLGFSDGGIEGLLLARDHPTRIASLVAIGANLTPEGVIDDPEWGLSEAVTIHREWALYWSEATHHCHGKNRTPIDTSLLSPTPEEAGITAELLQLMLDEPHIEAKSLNAISCPTTIMVGEYDCITEVETHAIVEAIRGAQLVVVPEAEHTLPKHNPDIVIQKLLSTVARAEQRGSHDQN